MPSYGGTSSMRAAQSIIAASGRTQATPIETSDVEKLRDLIDKQNLLIHTMLFVLLEKGVMSEKEFKEAMGRVDEMDGVKDGKLSTKKKPKVCGKCGSRTPGDKASCTFCGAKV